MAKTSGNDYQCYNALAVTPGDNELQPKGVKLFIGTGGSIKVKMSGNAEIVTFKNIADGTFLPIYVDFVYADDTDVTDILMLF